MNDDEVLALAQRGSIVAAAGCGKTELIAKAVGKCSGRQLVLTHTNAGVEAVRRRLRSFGVRGSDASVDTLDGWCLKYVAAYPRLSGGVPFKGDGTTDWPALRSRMAGLLGQRVIKKVIECSYEGVLVDEYQDCGEDQHALVCKLATVRSVRVLGDPLQAIFSWAGPLPDWSRVERMFPPLLTLQHPWRWLKVGANGGLGAWLSEARAAIEAKQQVRLRDGRLTLIPLSSPNGWFDAARDACFDAAKAGGSVVAICKWAPDCHMIASMTAGLFQCVEPIEAKHGAEMLAKLETVAAKDRPAVLFTFVKQVSVHAEKHLKTVRSALAKDAGNVPPEIADIVAKLVDVRDGGGGEECAVALEALLHLDGVRIFRRELAWAVLDTLRDVGSRPMAKLHAALRARRSLTSHVGRRLARCTVGTTLLLKGMEFDHAVVIHTGGLRGFSANDLYVALTRASKSLTVLSTVDEIDIAGLPGGTTPSTAA